MSYSPGLAVGSRAVGSGDRAATGSRLSWRSALRPPTGDSPTGPAPAPRSGPLVRRSLAEPEMKSSRSGIRRARNRPARLGHQSRPERSRRSGKPGVSAQERVSWRLCAQGGRALEGYQWHRAKAEVLDGIGVGNRPQAAEAVPGSCRWRDVAGQDGVQTEVSAVLRGCAAEMADAELTLAIRIRHPGLQTAAPLAAEYILQLRGEEGERRARSERGRAEPGQCRTLTCSRCLSMMTSSSGV